jgi:hypothetical protein
LFLALPLWKTAAPFGGQSALNIAAHRGERNPPGGFEMAKKQLKKGKKLQGAKTLGAGITMRGGGGPTS